MISLIIRIIMTVVPIFTSINVIKSNDKEYIIINAIKTLIIGIIPFDMVPVIDEYFSVIIFIIGVIKYFNVKVNKNNLNEKSSEELIDWKN